MQNEKMKLLSKVLIATLIISLLLPILPVMASEPPTITTTTLPGGNVGTPYSQQLQADGTEPFEWTLNYGNLPNGLTLSTAGIISGTPALIGTFIFEVRAENEYGHGTQTLTILVQPGVQLSPSNIQANEPPDGAINVAYVHNLQATGTAPITWSLLSGSLPAGLALSPEGVISGTPTIVGESTFSVRAVNPAGATNRQFTINILADLSQQGMGRLLITKRTPQQMPVPGFTFEVRRHFDEHFMGNITTNMFGEATIWLAPGEYYFREMFVPFAFMPSVTRTNFRITEGVVTTHNLVARPMEQPPVPAPTPVPPSEPYGWLRLYNRDVVTQALIHGAVYEVRSGGQVIRTINAGGSSSVQLPVGIFTVTQRTPAQGFFESTTPHTVSIRQNATSTLNTLSVPTVYAQTPPAEQELPFVPPPGGMPPGGTPGGGLQDIQQMLPVQMGRMPFIDVWESDWHYHYVRVVFQHGIFQGTERNMFSPDIPMTRAMFAQAVANFDGVRLLPVVESRFSDVDPEEWYAPAIEWAARLNLVDGVGDGRFAPNDNITREQMAVLAERYMRHRGIPLQTGFNTVLNDESQLSYWAVDAVGRLIFSDIISPELYQPYFFFRPRQAATRADVASMMARLVLAINMLNERLS